MTTETVTCKACLAEVPAAAKACMHCGSDPKTGRVRGEDQKNKDALQGCGCILLFAIIVAIVLALWTAGDTPPKDEAAASVGRATLRLESTVGDVGNVEVHLDEAIRGGAMLDRGAEAIADTAILDRVIAPTVTALNVTIIEHSGRKILHMSIVREKLRQLTDDAGSDAIFDAAQDIGWWTPTNDGVVRDYCRTHEARICADVG